LKWPLQKAPASTHLNSGNDIPPSSVSTGSKLLALGLTSPPAEARAQVVYCSVNRLEIAVDVGDNRRNRHGLVDDSSHTRDDRPQREAYVLQSSDDPEQVKGKRGDHQSDAEESNPCSRWHYFLPSSAGLTTGD
jgi:hypothetical protein